MEPRAFSAETTRGPGEPVVLVPGGLSGWNSWAAAVEVLSAERTVVRVQPTQNELGGSQGVVGDPAYSADVELAGLLATLDGLELDRVHVAGWSNGGKLALHLVLAHPERVRSLVLVEPAAAWILETGGAATPELHAFLESTERLAGREVSADDLAAFLVAAGVVTGDLDREALQGLPVWAASYPLRNALSWIGPGLRGDHHVDELASIRCPTLVVRGTETASWLSETAALVAERIPRAQLLELPGGHASHLQNADTFLAAVRRHLEAASD